MNADNNTKTKAVDQGYQGLTPGSFLTDEDENCVYIRLKSLPDYVYKCSYPSARKLLSAQGWVGTVDPELRTDEFFATKVVQICISESYKVDNDFKKSDHKLSFDSLIQTWEDSSFETMQNMLIDMQVVYGVFNFFRVRDIFVKLEASSKSSN